jgi:hypothetical protein
MPCAMALVYTFVHMRKEVYVVCSESFGIIFYHFFLDMPATEWALLPSEYSPPALMHYSQHHCHFWKESWYAFFRIVCSSVCEFSIISWIIWNCPFKVISVWEIRKSLPEPGQMSRMAEEAQLCLCCPKRHKSVAMHELACCHNGGIRSCFSYGNLPQYWTHDRGSHSAEHRMSATPVLDRHSYSSLSWSQDSHCNLFLIQDKGVAYPPSTSQSALIAEACLGLPLLRTENKYGGLQSIRISTRQSFVTTPATTEDWVFKQLR